MSDLWLHLRTEWKMLVRGPYLWMLAGAAAFLVWLVYSMEQDTGNGLKLVQQYSFLYSIPLTVGAVMTGIGGARRDRSTRTERILGALPYRTSLQLSVRLGMTAAPFVVLSLAPAGILLWQWTAVLPHAHGLGQALALQSVLSAGMVFPVALGWLTGILFPGRASFLAGVLVAVASTFGSLLIGNVMLPPAWYGLPIYLLFDLQSMGYYETTWGLLMDRGFWLHRAFYLLLTALVLILCIRLTAGKRREGRPVPAVRVGTAALVILLLLSAGGYAGVRQNRIHEYARFIDIAEARYVSLGEPHSHVSGPSVLWKAAAYSIEVDQEQDDALQATAVIRLRHEGSARGHIEEVPFTIHPSLKVEMARVNGQAASFRQEGYSVIVKPGSLLEYQSGPMEVELTYGGRLDQWRLVHNYDRSEQKLSRWYRATSKQWYLPGVAGWYPIPGSHALLQLEQARLFTREGWKEHYPDLGEAEFKVTVASSSDLPIVSTGQLVTEEHRDGKRVVQYRSTSSGFALFAGPVRELHASGVSRIRVIAGNTALNTGAEAVLPVIEETVNALDRLLGISRRDPLVMLVTDASIYPGYADLGGLITAGEFITSGNRDKEWVRSETIRMYSSYLLGIDRANNEFLLQKAFTEYVKQAEAGLSSRASVSFGQNLGPDLAALERFMNTSPLEQVENGLRLLLEAVRADPDGRLNLNDILRVDSGEEAGKPI